MWALQGIGEIKEGQAANVQAEARQQELAREAQNQKIAANQAVAENYRQLQQTTGAQKALAGYNGLNWQSPSALALEGGAERRADTNISRTSYNAGQQGENSRLAGVAAGMSGQSALTAGYLRGAGSFLKSATDAISLSG